MNYGIFVNEFQYLVVSSFIGSGAGFVISVWFVLAVVLNSEKKFIIAKVTVWVWRGVAIMNGQIVYVYRCLLTNCLHGKTMFSQQLK